MTNEERGERAAAALITYSNHNSDGDIQSAIYDLIADIAHYAEAWYEGGEDALRVGAEHYHAEVAEERYEPEEPTEAEKARLAYLRERIVNEDIAMGEIAELQGMANKVDPSDVLLLEWAGVPEEAWNDYQNRETANAR